MEKDIDFLIEVYTQLANNKENYNNDYYIGYENGRSTAYKLVINDLITLKNKMK